jgi:hypothetical protein
MVIVMVQLNLSVMITGDQIIDIIALFMVIANK